jgi:hypothetical protein
MPNARSWRQRPARGGFIDDTPAADAWADQEAAFHLLGLDPKRIQ